MWKNCNTVELTRIKMKPQRYNETAEGVTPQTNMGFVSSVCGEKT